MNANLPQRCKWMESPQESQDALYVKWLKDTEATYTDYVLIDKKKMNCC